MEEMKKTGVRLPKGRQRPIKTEWNSRCVLFTYFQGDISSVVDEHFSRALGNVKSPQELSPSSQSEDVILRNDSDMPPNQWRFSSQWTRPQPEVSLAHGATSGSLNVSGPVAMDQYPLALTASPSTQPGELWHFSSLASPSSPEPGYPHAFPYGHMVPDPEPDGNCEPFLSLLQHERCLACPQGSATRENCNSALIAGSPGLFLSLPPSSAHWSCLHLIIRKYTSPPNRGPASASLANERNWSPERRQDLFFY
ncbi:transcription cofactor vestigial-like protein 1 [Choloepus didactylus]|uniref:transcription cofactor vestigial-like protein 1 n=1 Tax=Choloepus didactylus TaxID=27675 RepID=UPI00189F381A|nr:transcription cofactor vestigial-like protein 1 [Choloepus didactylus]